MNKKRNKSVKKNETFTFHFVYDSYKGSVHEQRTEDYAKWPSMEMEGKGKLKIKYIQIDEQESATDVKYAYISCKAQNCIV